MAVTPEDVRHVAALARLRLDEAEAAEMTRQLNGILAHVDELEAVDVSDAEPVRDPDDRAPLRADAPGADPLAFGPDALAPAWEHGFITVPRLASHDDDELAAEAGAGEAG